MSEIKLYYLQDTRCVVGNSMMWWAIDGRGYTCDIRCAQIWTMDELKKSNYNCKNEYNEKYIPWPKDVIDRLVQHHVDHQDLQYKDNFGEQAKHPHTLVSHRQDLCL